MEEHKTFDFNNKNDFIDIIECFHDYDVTFKILNKFEFSFFKLKFK